MSQTLALDPIKKISGTVQLPGSKSLSNRVLVLSMLAEGTTHINNLLRSDDVGHMLGALGQLGVAYSEDERSGQITVVGSGGPIPARQARLFLGNSGTTMRSLCAALTLGRGRFVLDGSPRMRQRPIQDLVEGLEQLGAEVACLNGDRCPPVRIEAQGLRGGTTDLSGSISSQYLTAVLMCAPLAQTDVCIRVKGALVSLPYVAMTLSLMARFGVTVDNERNAVFRVKGNRGYRTPGTVDVEGDASSASYFLAGAAITGGTVTVRGCGSDSLQGDVQFAGVLERMGAKVSWEPQAITLRGGALRGIDVDMNAMPDAAMTLAVVGLFATGKTTIRNVYNWRVKETERMQAMVSELRKLGADVEEGRDSLVVSPPRRWASAAIDTYDDHRVAMAFSLAACGPVPVTINDPACVSKTFPDYFEVLNTLISR